jgi:hypothetical protein
MFKFILKLFNFDEGNAKAPKVKKISAAEVNALSNVVIRSDMYLPYYERSKPYKVFELAGNMKLYFIKDSKMIHDLTTLETVEENVFTDRKQRHKYNQSLLNHNPVASASLHADSYLKEQHKLFISLVTGIESQINQITIPEMNPRVKGREIVPFVIGCVAQCYLPMLLNVEKDRVPLLLTDFIVLLDTLEAATGKHKITFGDYLEAKENCTFSDKYEQQYIPLFHKIVLQLKNSSSQLTPSECSNLEALSLEIIDILTPECPIIKVLSSQFDLKTESLVVVNNMLSWMDNMLNVVHTIVNFLILFSYQKKETPQLVYSREYFQSHLPQARALATMFMRHCISDFEIASSEGQVISFHSGDILMMSNGNSDTVFGGNGRKCPSKPWSYIFVDKMMKHLTDRYDITVAKKFTVTDHGIPNDPENDSWFWNKFSPEGISLISMN